MATRRWLGTAVATADIKTITIAGTWAQNDTATITVNNKTLVLTVGTDFATTDVALMIKEAYEGATLTSSSASASPTNGQTIPELAEMTATVASSVVTLTGDTLGNPITMTASEVTAGSGTATLANATVATGPNHWDAQDNWSGNTVPVDADDIVWDSGDVDVKYGLDQSGVTPTSITVKQAYTGKIGLPETNEDNTAAFYREYRSDYLALGVAADATNITVTIGEGDGNGSGRVKLNFSDGQFTLSVLNSGQRADSAINSILIKGTHVSSELNVTKGDIAVAPIDGESGHLATLRVGWLENQAGDSIVFLGSGVDIANAAITQSGGTLSIDAATGSGTIALTGGELTVLSGAHAAIDVDGGVVYYRSTDTLTTGKIGGGGSINLTRDNRSRTITNLELHAQGTFLDPQKTVTLTNGVDLVRTTIAEVTLDLGNHVTLTPSAV